ncbi:MAG: hypothetical protein GY841_13875, partial [FCB group bacterium]|nr:hypothetical protein [FCB group bacterium]
AINGPDCDDTNVNAWDTCATCNDDDADTYYELCNAYVAINGPDACDGDVNNWTGGGCASCVDVDLDAYFTGCDAYATINGPDCDDADTTTYPGAPTPENPDHCDGHDNQCPGDPGFGQIDEGCGPTDTDGDGLTDTLEADTLGTDPNLPDTDGDGFGDYIEAITIACLDPLNDDSDADNLLDGVEDGNTDGVLDPGETDPCDPDSDDDGLNDDLEIGCLDPRAWDSDGDYLPDGYETANAGASPPLDPCDPADGDANFDGDVNANAHEYWNGTDLWSDDPVPNPALNPACYYWGDGDGDGIIGPGDVVTVQLEIAGNAQSYA